MCCSCDGTIGCGCGRHPCSACLSLRGQGEEGRWRVPHRCHAFAMCLQADLKTVRRVCCRAHPQRCHACRCGPAQSQARQRLISLTLAAETECLWRPAVARTCLRGALGARTAAWAPATSCLHARQAEGSGIPLVAPLAVLRMPAASLLQPQWSEARPLQAWKPYVAVLQPQGPVRCVQLPVAAPASELRWHASPQGRCSVALA